MKKLFLIIGVILFLTNCEEKCSSCTVKTTCTGGGVSNVTSTTFEACGSEIKEVDGKTITTTVTISGITVKCVAKTTCR